MIYESTGRLKLDATGLRVHIEHDFVNYYKKLIDMAVYNTQRLFTPRHGAHISVVIKSLHARQFDVSKLQKYHNRIVNFRYDTDIRIGGKGRGFVNYWMPVDFPDGFIIKRYLGIVDRNFQGFHITIASNKHEFK